MEIALRLMLVKDKIRRAAVYWTVKLARMLGGVFGRVGAILDAYVPEDEFLLCRATFEDDVIGCKIDVTDAVNAVGKKIDMKDVIPRDLLDSAENPRLIVQYAKDGFVYTEIVTGSTDFGLVAEDVEYEVLPPIFSNSGAIFYMTNKDAVEDVSERIESYSGSSGAFGAEHREDGMVEVRVGWITGDRDLFAAHKDGDSIRMTRIPASDIIVVKPKVVR